MKLSFLIAVIATFISGARAFSENCIAGNLEDFVSLVGKSEITAIIDVDNGKKKISHIVKGNIKEFAWITEGEYVYVGKAEKKQILYSIISSADGLKRVKIWQIKNGVVRYSIKGEINVEKLKMLVAEKLEISGRNVKTDSR